MSENKKDLLLDEELETEFDELEEQVDEVEIIELTDDKGNILKFFLVGETAYNGKEYAFFMPAQEIDGIGEGEVVVFEKGEKVETGRFSISAVAADEIKVDKLIIEVINEPKNDE